jgi:hypothetical protein
MSFKLISAGLRKRFSDEKKTLIAAFFVTLAPAIGCGDAALSLWSENCLIFAP